MIKTRKINVPIFNQSVTFISGDRSEVEDYLNDVYDVHATIKSNYDGIAISRGDAHYIWLDPEYTTIGVLIHELAHVTFSIMSYDGLLNEDQEAFCYILTYLVNECKNLFAIQMDLTNLVTENLDKVDEQASS